MCAISAIIIFVPLILLVRPSIITLGQITDTTVVKKYCLWACSDLPISHNGVILFGFKDIHAVFVLPFLRYVFRT